MTMCRHNNGSKDNGPTAKDNSPSPRTWQRFFIATKNKNTLIVTYILDDYLLSRHYNKSMLTFLKFYSK